MILDFTCGDTLPIPANYGRFSVCFLFLIRVFLIPTRSVR
jgi:hypothetical protein